MDRKYIQSTNKQHSDTKYPATMFNRVEKKGWGGGDAGIIKHCRTLELLKALTLTAITNTFTPSFGAAERLKTVALPVEFMAMDEE